MGRSTTLKTPWRQHRATAMTSLLRSKHATIPWRTAAQAARDFSTQTTRIATPFSDCLRFPPARTIVLERATLASSETSMTSNNCTMDDCQHTDYKQDLKAFLSASYWNKKLIN